MPTCSALGCVNRSDRGSKRGITFHKFPKNEDLKQQWIKAIRRENFIPSNGSCLCSAHFTEEFMDRTSLCCVRLREGAVPTVFPPSSSDQRKSKGRLRRKRTSKGRAEAEPETDLVLESSQEEENVKPTFMTLHKPFKEKEVLMLADEYRQLFETFQQLKDLARINIDLLLLSLSVEDDSEVKEELDKVQELVHTVMRRKEVYALKVVDMENKDIKDLNKQENEAKKTDDDTLKNNNNESKTWHFWSLQEKEAAERITVEAFYQHVLKLSSTFTEQEIITVFGRLLKKCLNKVFTGKKSNLQTRKLTFCYSNVSDLPFSSQVSGNMAFSKLEEDGEMNGEKENSQRHPEDTCFDFKTTRVGSSNVGNISIKQDTIVNNGDYEADESITVYFQSNKQGPEFLMKNISINDEPHTCEVCGKGYKHKSSLIGHTKCHKKEVYRCKVCSKEFKTQKKLGYHQLRHREKNSSPHLQEVEGLGGNNKLSQQVGSEMNVNANTTQRSSSDGADDTEDLEELVGLNDNEGDEKLGLPLDTENKSHDVMIQSKRKSDRRIKKTDNEYESNTCEFCGKTYKHKSSLVEHMKYHDNKVYTCTICSKEFKTKKVLCDHQRYHKKQGASKHLRLRIKRETGSFESTLCSICGFESKNRNSLLRHLRDHEEFNKNGPQKCALCGKEFKVKMSLMRHMGRHTAAEGSFMCDICGKTFKLQNSMKCHRRIHVEGPESCPICGKSISKHNLRRHIKSHSGDKPYECSICHKGFARRSGRNIHQRRHTRVYPHRCSYCDKGFISPNKLLIHERIHSGERPFSCTVCGKFFISNALAQAHIAKHGPNADVKTGNVATTYACDICGKRFNSKFSQVRHLHNHSSVKPYKCMICGTAFSTKFGLKSHSWTHSKEKRFQCVKCEKGFNDKRHFLSHVKKSHPEDHAMMPI